MNDITSAAALVRDARLRAGLTQRELAAKAGVEQPVIARIERAGSNPTLQTLTWIVRAAGFRVRMILEPMTLPDPVVERYKQDVDRTLLRENLKRSVDERIRSLGEWQEVTAQLQEATKRARSG